jgi:hypothetical protein
MKKQLPTHLISSELSQSSVFFQKPTTDQPPAPVEKPVKAKSSKPRSLAAPRHSPPPVAPKSNQSTEQAEKQESSHDVMTSIMTLQSQDLDLRKWQEIIEDTVTQNSALRLTSEERFAIEDVVSELRRKYGIKTSMNEIARLGLLLLIHDFKQNKKESMIHAVKKA